MRLLDDSEWAGWNDSKIARHCAVDHKTVAAYRPSILGISQEGRLRLVERGGVTFAQNTAAIGHATRAGQHGARAFASLTSSSGAA
jgi:hypothetical protein